jgi:hypothetical protein
MLEVERRLNRAFPWSLDLHKSGEAQRQWGPFALSGDGVKYQRGRDPRVRPFEAWLPAMTESGAASVHAELSSVGSQIDAAVRTLRLEEAKLAAGGRNVSLRRDIANLRLFAFWLETCAFHAESLCSVLEDLDQRKRDLGIQGDPALAVVPVVRLSDCFNAYDGRTVSADEERLLQRRAIDWSDGRRGYMTTMLGTPLNDLRYRARRSLSNVERPLNASLRSRLGRVVAAGQRVLDDYARTPWGWMVYYSELMQVVLDDRIGSPFSLDRCGNVLAGPLPPVTMGGGAVTPR